MALVGRILPRFGAPAGNGKLAAEVIMYFLEQDANDQAMDRADETAAQEQARADADKAAARARTRDVLTKVAFIGIPLLVLGYFIFQLVKKR